MHYARYLERISVVKPGSIERNNAIETHQKGGAVQIAQIQTVRQVLEDNLPESIWSDRSTRIRRVETHIYI